MHFGEMSGCGRGLLHINGFGALWVKWDLSYLTFGVGIEILFSVRLGGLVWP
jgi:hypothetical protein